MDWVVFKTHLERRALGRSGAGAVMGSKDLKAIAVRGKAETPLFNPALYNKNIKLAFKELQENPITSKVLLAFGSEGTLNVEAKDLYTIGDRISCLKRVFNAR